MEAAEAKIQRVLEGSNQFLVPHYQRPYSWRDEQWRTLWRDIRALIADPDSKPHFLASIVTSPARSVHGPGGLLQRFHRGRRAGARMAKVVEEHGRSRLLRCSSRNCKVSASERCGEAGSRSASW
jgi:hypothetical protein